MTFKSYAISFFAICAATVSLLSAQAAAQSTTEKREAGAQEKEQKSDHAKALDARFLYTGSTYGYLRLPDRQNSTLKFCPDSVNDGNDEAKTFLRAVDTQKDHILLGMGDNFSLELYSRVMQFSWKDKTGMDRTEQKSKDMYIWDYKPIVKTKQNGEKESVATEEDASHAVWRRLVTKEGEGLDPVKDELLIESLYAGNGHIPADNVGCLLSRAGYKAIVPGKLDFYFGPGYLRFVARFLANPAQGPDYKPVQMLGANLAIETTVDNAAPRIPFNEKRPRLEYTNQPPAGFSFDVPPVVLPWIRKFRMSLPDGLDPKAADIEICPAEGPFKRDPDDASLPGHKRDQHQACTRLKSAGDSGCSEREGEKADKQTTFCVPPDIPGKEGDGKEVKVHYTYLQPNNDYLLCYQPGKQKGTEQKPYCRHLSVYSPFFNYPNPIPAPGEQKRYRHMVRGLQECKADDMPPEPDRTPRAGYCDPEPYAFVGNDETGVVIFGVVDQDITQYIGKLNDVFINTKHNYTTALKLVDPVEALHEQLEYFHEQHPDFHGMRVLLAQMPAYKARRIATVLRGRFNLVIAQPQFEEATPAITQEVQVAKSPELEKDADRQGGKAAASSPSWRRHTFLAVPGPFFDDTLQERLTLQLRAVELSLDHRCSTDATCIETWSFANKFVSGDGTKGKTTEQGASAVAFGGQPPVGIFQQKKFTQAVEEALRGSRYVHPIRVGSNETDPVPKGAKDQLRSLALTIMQAKTNADLALLQQRDVWGAWVYGPPDANTMQEYLDRVFWKGDFLMKIMVRGDVLKKVLQQSDKFDQQDKDTFSLDEEKERGLSKLGIFLDSSTSKYMVNGEPLDENKMYAVATTDYIALGDTGYPDLQTPAVGGRVKPEDLKDLHYISGLLCQEIRDHSKQFSGAACNNSGVNGNEYFDELDQAPFDTTPGLSGLRRLLAWSRPDLPRKARSIYPKKTLDSAVEQRPVWSLDLTKLAVAFTMNQHNHGRESNLASLFAGVPNTQVNAPNTNTTSFDTSIRLQRSSQHVELFEQSDATYSRQLTRQNDKPNTDVEAQLKNQLALEAGILPRLFPRTKEIPDLKVLLSLRFETQVAPPLTSFKIPGGATLRQDIGRYHTLAGKIGFRYQNQKSFLETGVQIGALVKSPIAYVFTPGTTCFATNAKKANSLANCVNPSSGPPPPITVNSVVTTIRDTRPQDGVFLNFKVNVPLPGSPKLFYIMENKGQFFFNRSEDVSIDTKLYEDWSHSFAVPVWGNFSVVPKLEFIAFENKIDRNFFWTYQPSLSLQYSFDWRPGLGWKNALRYQNPQAVSKTGQ